MTELTGRVLVTGSRDWLDNAKLRFQLRIACRQIPPLTAIVIFHGDCPTGADRMAAIWAAENGLRAEPHPAQWRLDGVYNRAAGFRRNAEMVELGADLCLAFIRSESRGATHCAALAERAGIPVRRFRE